jgi:hypothetical protein
VNGIKRSPDIELKLNTDISIEVIKYITVTSMTVISRMEIIINGQERTN